jgi:hypothetical protein
LELMSVFLSSSSSSFLVSFHSIESARVCPILCYSSCICKRKEFLIYRFSFLEAMKSRHLLSDHSYFFNK